MYKIILMIGCAKCSDCKKVYTSPSERIQIYNIATEKQDNDVFLLCLDKILQTHTEYI